MHALTPTRDARAPASVATRIAAGSVAAWAASTSVAFAHHTESSVAVPGWTWDPAIVVPLVVAALLFAGGWRRLRERTRHGTERLARRAMLFAAGWAVLAAALVSPLHEAGERSFSAHMIEHELLMLFAAPLLVAAEPLVVMLWAFAPPLRRTLGHIVAARPVAALWTRSTGPVTATLVQAAALWLWHAPRLFDLALASDGWHIAQHASFVGSALLFWRAMLRRRADPRADAATRGVAALCLFATSIVSGALGALMAFSESPWYAGYARLGMAPFGLTAAEDQQIAGLVMWIPGGLVHAIAALVLVRAILSPAPRREVGHAV